MMDYDAIVAQALTLLQRERRLSYRVLKLRLHLDDDTLEALKEDLIYAKQCAVDDEGRVLVWTGHTDPAPSPVMQDIHARLYRLRYRNLAHRGRRVSQQGPCSGVAGRHTYCAAAVGTKSESTGPPATAVEPFEEPPGMHCGSRGCTGVTAEGAERVRQRRVGVLSL